MISDIYFVLFNKWAAFEAFTYVKDRVDIMDNEKHLFKYTVIEGGPIDSKLKSYSIEIQFQATSSEGCLSKMTLDYDTINDSLLPEEKVAKMKEGIMGMGKAMEAYLQANPDAYVWVYTIAHLGTSALV